MNVVRNFVLTLAGIVTAFSAAWAAPIDGPMSSASCVRARTTDIYDMWFRGGELAMIRVSGDGDTDLDVYVYDRFGNLIASDSDFTDECLVFFTPRSTGRFKIRVVNRGNVYNCYTIRAL